MKKHFFVLSVSALLAAGFCCGAVEGIVTASALNARVFPELKSPAAVKLYRGKKVEIFQRHGAWLEIAAPDVTPVYASAVYLNGNVALRDMNLRIRPHGKAAVIGRIKKGTVLKAVTEPNRYGWVQVAPLADMRLYVMRDYVNYDSSKVPVARKANSPAPAPAPEKKVAPAPAPVPVKKAAPVPAPEKKVAPAPAPEKKVAPAPAPEKKVAPAPTPVPVKKAAPAPAPEKKAAPTPAPEKKAAPAPAPAPEKKVAPAPEKKVAPAPEKKAAPVPAPAPEKKVAPAPVKKVVPVPAVKAAFDLLPQRKRELINIGADITRNSEYNKTGRLVAVPNPSGDCTTYALVNSSSGMNQGFIFAEAPIDLKKMLEKNVAVKGFAYKVAKWSNPVVCALEVKVVGE